MKWKSKTLILVLAVVIAICPMEVKAFDMPTGYTKMDKDLKQYIEKICEEYYICPDLIIAMAERESSLRYDAVSSAGCVGLMQIYPKWHKERMERLGVTDLLDPKQNVLVAVDFLSELFERCEDIYAVLMYYNGGYSDKAGIRAYEQGVITRYALDIANRSEDLERIRENEQKIEKMVADIKWRYVIWKN